MINNAIFAIIALTITVIVVSNVFIPTVKGTNTSTWTTGEVALWGVITLVAIAGFVYNTGSAFGLS